MASAFRITDISQTGMAKVLGLSPRGNALPRFLANKIMSESVGAEIREKVEKPLKFQWSNVGAGTPPVTGGWGHAAEVSRIT